MIGNAHIDPVWLWQWQEGFQEIKATYRSALDRMREFPEFIFTSSSAAFFEWVEHNDPAMFREIQQRVAEGRWCIVGGWWLQPDCNIPDGESFARHALYAQHYFQEKFGVTARVGYVVDSFGHNAMLPQLLKLGGLDSFIFLRPGPAEKGLPNPLFWWESDDGTRVLAFRILYGYDTSAGDIEKHVRRCMAELRAPFDELMCFYGVGDHGGGPTRENIESISHLNQDPQFPRLVFSSPNQFFQNIPTDNLPIPVIHDELQHHASGCYAAHSGIKRWNRRAENLLMVAEKMSVLAEHMTGHPYSSAFEHAWKNVLFNQFHDILSGTSIEAAYDDARNTYGEALAIADRALNHATQSIAWNIRIESEPGVQPFVVFNPHTWAGRFNVEIEVGRWGETSTVVDDHDQFIVSQLVQPWATTQNRKRLSLIAELPALGYRVYRIVAREKRENRAPASLSASDSVMENSRFRLQFDPTTGYLTSLFDKRIGGELILDHAAKPVVIDDPSDTWGHNVFRFNRVSGAFTAMQVQLVEFGAVQAVIRVTSAYGNSTLTQDFTMYEELDQIDVHVTVDWHEQFKLLKLRFPLKLNFPHITYAIPYGHIRRDGIGVEDPGQSWIDLSGVLRDTGDAYGLAILNNSKYSYDVDIRDIGLTVLRSPIYAHHIPFVPREDQHYSFIDQGVQHFTYTLLPHAGSWEDARTVKRALELNQRPIVLPESYHPEGTLPQSDANIAVEPDNIVVTVLKKAHDNDDLILRAYETIQAATDATIHLPKWNRTIAAHFRPCEIKTFRIPRDAGAAVVETNFLER